ncbi:MAG TPA: protein kinase, partial [Deltaproteobacteria bacterium]|nr:protein kinase [Deltaproteobacteria bacterium]
GEVLVLDWGLAKILGRNDLAAADGELDPVQTDRSRDNAHQTQVGKVAGTPAYMPPEQARGEVNQIDARSDVYAIGAMIYELLSGRPPYVGNSAMAVLQQVRSGPPPSLLGESNPMATFGFDMDFDPDPVSSSGPPLPPALVTICGRAMAREPADRYATAGEIASELQAWLDGDQRRDDALKVVDRAATRAPEAMALRQRAAVLREEATAFLKDVADWQPEEDKLVGWRKEDEAAALEKQAELVELVQVQLLQGSLTHAPDLPEAHAALAARYRSDHAAAEVAREDTARVEALFRQHVAALPEDHTDRINHLTYLRGDGALTLFTDPPGAEVRLHRYELHNRRLVPRFQRSLGRTPLRRVALPRGSYLCILKHPDRAEVRYPISIGRGEHWHGVPPDSRHPHTIPLPHRDELGPDDRYMPAGWFACGGDPNQDTSLSARRVWVDGRVFRRFPVTNRQYMDFLDALVASGRSEEALRHAPREKGGTVGELGSLIYGFDGERFFLRPDAEGDQWEPENPVFLVDWHAARAFAAWEAARTGHPWRLTGELAREKAARGVDGRFFPWGDGFDPSWTCMGKSHKGRILPRPVGTFAVDESPYGIRDMAGSIGDWCLDAFVQDGAPPSSARGAGPEAPANLSADEYDGPAYRTIRGACWFSAASWLRSANRDRLGPSDRYNFLGFRLARSYP